MTDQAPDPIPGWRYGLDPRAAGLAIVSMDRVRHRLGIALRIQLSDPEATGGELHVQWFIATQAGPWALWTTCAPAELAAREAALAAVTWFDAPTEDESLAELRG